MQSIPISIPGKESVPIAAYLDGPPQSRRLVVFLNGMVAPSDQLASHHLEHPRRSTGRGFQHAHV